MTFSSLITGTSPNGGQYSARQSRVDRIILHHAASTSLSGVLSMMETGSRQVSSNYVIGNSGEIVGVVPEEFRAWTSGSTSWDGRAITFEIINETGGPDWRISDAAFASVTMILADISVRYGIPLNRDTVITHQELYTRYGASYATACPGPFLQPKIDALISLATSGSVPTSQKEDEDMRLVWDTTGNGYLVTTDGALPVGSPLIYNLFYRLLNSNQLATPFVSEVKPFIGAAVGGKPHEFTRTEVGLLDTQFKLLAASVKTGVAIDVDKLAAALGESLGEGLTVTAELTVEDLARAYEGAAPRIIRALGKAAAGVAQ